MNEKDRLSMSECIQLIDESIDDFPLPPSTPLVASFHDVQDKNSVPALNRNFRFPIISSRDNHHELEDPEQVYQRLRHESNLLAARLAQDFTELESPTRSCCSGYSERHSYHNYKNKPDLQLRPQTSYNPSALPRFPFNDFAGWDLTREADEADDAKRDGEDVILPHASQRLRASSLYCRVSPWRKEKLEFTFPALPSKSQGSHDSGIERVAKEDQEDRILYETREAALAISKAGFNFGFEDSVPAIKPTSSVHPGYSAAAKPMTDLDPDHVTQNNSPPPNSDHEMSIRNTVVTVPARLSSLTPPLTCDPLQPRWPMALGDSGVELMPLPLTPKSAPACISRFPDLPKPMLQNDEIDIPPRSGGGELNNREGISTWSPTPEPEESPPGKSRYKFLNDPLRPRMKRWGLWGKIKNSMFSRRNNSSTP